jgi:prepilin-type N-terminal cleavage/methylation domain-containing protein
MPRRGFTLIELLIVIVIIGGLMALLTPTIWNALQTAKRTAILAEIDQLHSGVQAYKEQHLVYPPAMAVTNTNTRKSKFMSHLRTVYPSSAYGVRVTDFDTLATYIATNYRVQGGTGTIPLDLNKLDQSEALVFWLGGFPTPVSTGTGGGQPIAPSRLFGFNRDKDSPIKRSIAAESTDPLATRTTPYVEFRQERLVDNDGDGWWEYLPMSASSGDTIAPYVYFDSESYGGAAQPSECLPYPRTGDSQHDSLVQSFGTVVPFAAYFDPAGRNPTRWQNSSSFQIICCGLDGKYSDPDLGARVTVFPAGHTFAGPKFNSMTGNYSDLELDNLTNIQRVPLGDAKAEAR